MDRPDRIPELLSLKEAAALLRVSVRQVGRLIEKGRFPWYQIEERKMIDRADVVRYIEGQRRAA